MWLVGRGEAFYWKPSPKNATPAFSAGGILYSETSFSNLASEAKIHKITIRIFQLLVFHRAASCRDCQTCHSSDRLFQRGNYLVVRCPSDREYEDWKCSLETQIVDIKRTNYVRPVLRACAGRKRVSNHTICFLEFRERCGTLVNSFMIKAVFACLVSLSSSNGN